MAKEKYYRYYVEPKDEHTNKVLSRELVPRYECAPRKLWNGKTRPAWEVPEHYLLAFFQRSRASSNLKFVAYVQENEGQIRPWIFDAAKSNPR